MVIKNSNPYMVTKNSSHARYDLPTFTIIQQFRHKGRTAHCDLRQTPYDFRYPLKTIINLIICLHYNYEIRALRHSKVFIQNITGNSHYAMNESERKFFNYLIISSFSTQLYISFEDLL